MKHISQWAEQAARMNSAERNHFLSQLSLADRRLVEKLLAQAPCTGSQNPANQSPASPDSPSLRDRETVDLPNASDGQSTETHAIDQTLINQNTAEPEATVLENRPSDHSPAMKDNKASTAMPAPGDEQSPRYIPLREHARGGLGEVFVAEDQELHREVALKQIQARFAGDPESRSRFLLEAEVTGALEHPGIVPIYGLGTDKDGRPYYAMRFIRGESLKAAIDRWHGRKSKETSDAPLTLRQLLGRFVDVCQAIGYAHSRGIIHRDIKPDNVMLGTYGETLVVDWGLAKLTGRVETAHTNVPPPPDSEHDNSNVTVAGSTIGTPAFMSPEQASGDLEKMGPTSDIYSLGASLYYLLTGKVSVSGRNLIEVLDQVRSGQIPAPRTVRSDIAKGLEAICLKAMSHSASDRYRTASELAADIEAYLADEPITAMNDPLIDRCRRWIRKHQVLAATSTAVALVTIIGLGLYQQLAKARAEREAIAEARSAATERTLREEAAAERDRARRTVADMCVLQGMQAQQNNRTDLGALWFAEALREQEPNALAKIRVREYLQAGALPVWATQIDEPGVTKLAMHPDDRHVMLCAVGTNVRIWNCLTGSVWSPPVPESTDSAYCAAQWNRNGGLLAIGADTGRVAVMDFPTGTLRLNAEVSNPIRKCEFSADDQWLAVANGPVIDFINLTRPGEDNWQWDFDEQVLDFSFSDDGRRVAAVDATQHVALMDLHRQTPIALEKPVTHTYSDSFLSDPRAPLARPPYLLGPHLFTVERDAQLRRLNMKTQSLSKITGSFRPGIFGVSPDLQHFAYEAPSGYGATVFNIPNQDMLTQIKTHTNTVTTATFDATGELLATSSLDGHVRVMRIASGEEICQPIQHAGTVRQASLGTKRIATIQEDGLLRVWALPASQFRETAIVDTSGNSTMGRFSHDHRVILPTGNSNRNSKDEENVLRFHRHLAPDTTLTVTGRLTDAIALDDSQHVVLAVDDSLQFYDLNTSRPFRNLVSLTDEVRSIDYSPQSDRLAALTADGNLFIIPHPRHESQQPEALRPVQPPIPPSLWKTNDWINNGFVRFSPDGSKLVTCAFGPEFFLFDMDGKLLLQGEHSRKCHTARFSQSNRYLVTGGHDNCVQVWSMESLTRLKLYTLSDWIHSATLSSDDQQLLVACRDGHAYLINRNSGQTLLSLPHESEVTAAEFARDESLIITGTSRSQLRQWDSATGRQITPTVDFSKRSGIVKLEVSGQHNMVLVSGLSSTVRAYPLPDPTVPEIDSGLLRTLAELTSMYTIENGSVLRQLNGSQWLSRWRGFDASSTMQQLSTTDR